VDADGAFDESAGCGRRSRVVLTPRRWRQVCGFNSQATVTTKPDHRGEREGSRKTIARGMPGDSGVTVVTNARVYYTPRAAAGASGARHSLRPLMSEGGMLLAKLARMRGEIADLCPTSLPATNAKRLRKGAERRSNPFFLCASPWIASLTLAMTRNPSKRG
jgi:hypothetical protein